MRRWLAALCVAGAVCVTAGVAWIFPPAGLIVGGSFALAAGLLIEDGEQ